MVLIIVLSFCAIYICKSIFFPSLFWNQNRLGFKKILEIKLLEKALLVKKNEIESKESWYLN